MYINQELSQRQVAKKLKISQTQVRRELEKSGIKSRGRKEGKKLREEKVRQEKSSIKKIKKDVAKIEKVCEFCGKNFTIYNCYIKRKYCSKECANAVRIANQKRYFCKLCGEEIIFPENTRRYKRVYCDSCLKKGVSFVPTKKIKTTCGYCGKELQVIPSRYEANKFCYCDTKCMAKHYAEIYSGENSPTWKGGKGHHYIGGFYHARKEARKRDNYTCQICGITEENYGHELSVHHIKNYRLFKNKEEANNLDNLISLCEPCHRFVHSNSNIDKIYIKE